MIPDGYFLIAEEREKGRIEFFRSECDGYTRNPMEAHHYSRKDEHAWWSLAPHNGTVTGPTFAVSTMEEAWALVMADEAQGL